MSGDLKIGVFLCECGGNISDTVDLDEVRQSLDVEVIEQFENLCSLNGQTNSVARPASYSRFPRKKSTSTTHLTRNLPKFTKIRVLLSV